MILSFLPAKEAIIIMNNIIKMVNLDMSLLKPYKKYYLMFLLIPIIITLSTKDINSSIIFFMCMIAMTSNYTFSVAEKNDLNRLYGLIPVSKIDIVAGRYIFSALTGAVTAVAAVIINILILVLSKTPIIYLDVVASVSIGLLMYFFFTAIQLPGYFKFGAIKGRFITFIPFLGIFLAGVIAKSINTSEQLTNISITPVLSNTYILLVFSILLDIVIYCISIAITYSVYNRMEF
jgi:hypothetical protein